MFKGSMLPQFRKTIFFLSLEEIDILLVGGEPPAFQFL
jgi:hypothetical protein